MWSFLGLLKATKKRGRDSYPCFWRPISLVQDNHYHQKFHYYSMDCRIKFFTLERFSIEQFSVFEDVTSNSNLYIQGNMTPPCLVNSPQKALILTFIFCIFLAVMISISSWVNIQSRRAICHESYVSGLCKIFLGSDSPGWYGLFKKNDFLFLMYVMDFKKCFLNDWLVNRFPDFTRIPQLKKSTLES